MNALLWGKGMVVRRTRLLVIVSAILVFAAGGLALADQPEDKVQAGAGAFAFTPDVARPLHKLKVWTYRPDGFGPNNPIVFVMHGVRRNGENYRDAWIPLSRARSFLLVVPEFPKDEYPGEAYQRGNITDRAGKPVPPERWTFNVIEKLFDHVKTLTESKAEKYYLYGHSAGGQFVQRFVLFMPEARYARAIAANPGYYTFPIQNVNYPYGLKGTPVANQLDPVVFARDFVLLLGAEDTNQGDPNLRKTPEADAQGLTRFARGINYFQTATRVAETAHVKFNWRLVTVAGVGHSNTKMAPSAARELFSKLN
jgi:poly(3-hydroxybutyrate) depolymerase